MRDVRFDPLTADDVLSIQRQPSQAVLGLPGAIESDAAEMMAGGLLAFAVRRAGRLIACIGVTEQFAGVQGLAWAVLAEGVGTAHLALTRFARARIAECPLPRIEALAKAPDVEPLLARVPWPLDAGQIAALAWRRPTPEMRWAAAVGLSGVHVLRRFGDAGESFMLMERIRPPACLADREAA